MLAHQILDRTDLFLLASRFVLLSREPDTDAACR